ncbi:Monooxygenase af470-like protein [Penicillium ucsense]|uniref:Monooxygenase af470-like protein n=1 Tax=Penicillium ucsense TaxID=2839758 RepID=A0A8J8W5R8_9EURO|nr:Monooxygenase af470-like protein [Penicillium ucsense]KAF7738241.1 Monooxygenase af470-like protein [Penicillium ucsense]
MTSSFRPLLPPHIVPPSDPDQRGTPIPFPRKNGSFTPVIRDTMSLTSWLLLGAVIQGLACLLFGSRATIPALLILIYRVTDHLLMTLNITRNRYLDHVLLAKASPQIPHPTGTFGTEPSRDKIVVFHLGVRSHHPLGFLAPGMKGIADEFTAMVSEMQADPEKVGLLGMSQFLKQESVAGNEILTIFYLRDYESLHRFAYGESHMKGVRYFADITKKCPHIGIFHETFVVPKGHWEAIYINTEPTGLGDTWFLVNQTEQSGHENPAKEKVKKEEKGTGARAFIRPLVDARSGILRSKTGRLSMKKMEEARQYDQVYGET